MSIDYEGRKAAILASTDIEQLRRADNMPPVPRCEEDQNFIFISYSHKDYKAVYCDLLEFHKKDLRYWYDEGLPAGEAWDKVVEGQIKHPHCAGVIFYMSENLFLSRSVNKEVEFTVGGEDGSERKNSFCVNLSDMPPMKIIHTIQRTREYEELEQSGFIDCLSCLTNAFNNKVTYIPKACDGDAGHIPQALKQIQDRFGVFVDGAPIENDEQVQKLAKEVELAKVFAIKDGVLQKYMGVDPVVMIPQGVTEIGKGAFEGCEQITRVEIPEGVTRIGEEAFRGCRNLEFCSIPDSVTSIDDYVFNGCSSLLSMIIPDGVTCISSHAFSGCTALTSITIPDCVDSIRASAFEGCIGLIRVTLPESIIDIGDSAFSECENLSHITLLKHVKNIGEYAFYGCERLTSITVPHGITGIEFGTFANCDALMNITIPDRVTNIGKYAFYGCKSLTDIIFIGTKAQWKQIEKGEDWDTGTGDYVVHCVDGNLSKGEA